MKKLSGIIIISAITALMFSICVQAKTVKADNYFVTNDYYNMTSEGTLHLISHFKTDQQTTDYTCGCIAAKMVFNYYGIYDFDEMYLCEAANTDPTKGTSVEAMADLFSSLEWNVETHADTEAVFEDEYEFEKFIVEKIDAKIPVIVDWVDWGGHWQVIIGIDTCDEEDIDDDVLIIADPCDLSDHCQDGYYTYPMSRFFYMWQEGACAQKAEPYVQPYVIATPNF